MTGHEYKVLKLSIDSDDYSDDEINKWTRGGEWKVFSTNYQGPTVRGNMVRASALVVTLVREVAL